MKCPSCNCEIEVRFIKAPPMQSSQSTSGSLSELMEQIHDDELENDFQIEFMKGFRERFAKYGDRTIVSEKQMSVLRKIAAGSAD